MEPSKVQAKKGILKKDQTGTRFTDIQLAAHQAELEMTREQNRHAKEMRTTELGFLGKFFGDGRNTQTFVALIAVFSGVSIFATCLFAAYCKPVEAHFWSESGSKSLAFAGTALGYLFGRGAVGSRK
ncbi:hypothetical protein SAMN04487996_103268 [Dyadobacter soli]|uniref:Uncharacterized protein n=1 Tax=Dyadobacter soli TaxID=659014 RepID=A0A1G6ZXE7_9BACT|nr:hypothetical protein [Dyadobacter soli]SDE07239.1 hypothetical protein SAMN04487996_103268 [Dyadobacter soli]